MNQINQIAAQVKEQALSKSQRSLTESSQKLIKTDQGTFISKYSGEISREMISKCSAKIKAAFPNLPIEFFEIFSDRVIDNGFSNEKLNDAVNHVIDNCVYPNPTIAQFLSYDAKIRLYTYQEMAVKVNDANGEDIWKYYDKKKIDNIIYWFKKQ